MAKATLEFDLSDEFDKDNHMRAVKATDAYLALSDICEHLRQLDRYHKDEETNISQLRTDIYNILQNHNINLDEELK